MPSYITPILFLIIFVLILYRVLFKNGYRGSMRGMKDSVHIGEVGARELWLIKTKFRVHKLVPKQESVEQSVGIELVTTTPLSFQMTPMRLTVEQAQELGELLLESAEESEKAINREDIG